MQTDFQLTKKQAEYIRNAHHRWNVACGAVRSGKSYCQISYCIPSRLLERHGKRGMRLILGATQANIERNVLQPMRDIYGDQVATGINSKNWAKICGEKVYCIGADNIRQVAKIRGSEVAYCAIDEATDINQQVFDMLKSRLSLPWSCCDITTNPSYPSHWFKEFLDSREHGVDIYLQEYQIYDNPFLPKDYVRNLEVEYEGTVLFDRYILGKWALAEGLIYPMFKEALEEPPEGIASEYVLSVDYGTMNAFAGILWARRGRVWYMEDEYYYSGRDEGDLKTDEEYVTDLVDFTARVPRRTEPDPFGRSIETPLTTIVDPSAASFIEALRRRGGFRVIPAMNDVEKGIQNTMSALKWGYIKASPSRMKNWRKEIEGYVWDEGLIDKPVKVNDHLMDSMRYFVQTMNIVPKLEPRPENRLAEAFPFR